MDQPVVMNYGNEEFAKIYEDRASNVISTILVEHAAMQYFGNLQGKSIVEFGCGTGMVLKKYLSSGANFCLGIDINDAMITSGGSKAVDELTYGEMRQSNEKPQLCFLVKYCFKPFDELNRYGQFDFVIDQFFFTECKNEDELETCCKNAYGMLKSKGKIYIGQYPFAVGSIKDQEILMDLCGLKYPLKKDLIGKGPFFYDIPAFNPAPASISKTGRPYTRTLAFTYTDVYSWPSGMVMEKLMKVGFVNVQLLPPVFPDDAPLHERKQIESLEEPFTMIGAEKP